MRTLQLALLILALLVLPRPTAASPFTDFRTDYTQVDASQHNACWPDGIYALTSSVGVCHDYWAPTADYDGDGEMMLVNGFADAGGKTVWAQDRTQEAGTYTFQAWLANLCCINSSPTGDFRDTNLPILLFYLNDTLLGQGVTDGAGVWVSAAFSYTLTTAQTVTLSLRNLADEYSGNDFALDGINSTPTPEPASLILLGTGLAGIARLARKRRRHV